MLKFPIIVPPNVDSQWAALISLPDNGIRVIVCLATLFSTDLIEPSGPYNEIDYEGKEDEGSSPSNRSPAYYGSTGGYQHLPDSPESLVGCTAKSVHYRGYLIRYMFLNELLLSYEMLLSLKYGTCFKVYSCL